MALFPEGRISEVQRRFMTTATESNVACVAVKGSFDDCQAIVKNAFQDQSLRQAVDLSGVNSINFARIAAQAVYYFTTAAQLGAPDRKVSFAVTSGNFGDAFAGYVAHRMGLPIGQILVATNANDILARTFETGRYARGKLNATMSPAMDIQSASNFERLYFECVGREATETARAFAAFADSGAVDLPPKAYAAMRELFRGAAVSEADTARTMVRTLNETGQIVDPHTAVALRPAPRRPAGSGGGDVHGPRRQVPRGRGQGLRRHARPAARRHGPGRPPGTLRSTAGGGRHHQGLRPRLRGRLTSIKVQITSRPSAQAPSPLRGEGWGVGVSARRPRGPKRRAHSWRPHPLPLAARGRGMTPRVHTLSNGVRVVCDPIPGLETVALSVVAGQGARAEGVGHSGWSHLLEHMVFKGAGGRSAREIVEVIEAQGGNINAATGYERTSFQIRALAGGLDLGSAVLADLVQRPAMDAADLAKEKQVVAQEIAEAADAPDDLVFELAQAAAFEGHSLGRPILGTPASIGTTTPDTLGAWRASLYGPETLVVSAAGAVDEDDLLRLAERDYGQIKGDGAAIPPAEPARFTGGQRPVAKTLEQANIVLLLPAVGVRDEAYFPLRLLAEILGGGMASRLFQEARENRGLAYTIDAYSETYADTGVLGGLRRLRGQGRRRTGSRRRRRDRRHAEAAWPRPNSLAPKPSSKGPCLWVAREHSLAPSRLLARSSCSAALSIQSKSPPRSTRLRRATW